MLTIIKNDSENDWDFFVEMDHPSFDIKGGNDFKKKYWKMNYQLNTIQEEDEDEKDHDIFIHEKQTKMMNNKTNIYMLFHYITATLVILSFAYFVFCIL